MDRRRMATQNQRSQSISDYVDGVNYIRTNSPQGQARDGNPPQRDLLASPRLRDRLWECWTGVKAPTKHLKQQPCYSIVR